MVRQVELFSFVFCEDWRHQKDILKLTDLYLEGRRKKFCFRSPGVEANLSSANPQKFSLCIHSVLKSFLFGNINGADSVLFIRRDVYKMCTTINIARCFANFICLVARKL